MTETRTTRTPAKTTAAKKTAAKKATAKKTTAKKTSAARRPTPRKDAPAAPSSPSEDVSVPQAGEDRAERYRRYAEARARGEVVVPPQLLQGHARRTHVRETLMEDHRTRIDNRPEGAQTKFDTLASDAFTFFRGTALLYYRDHAGTDGHLPVVFTIGDVHPENFGVMPNSDGAPFFGANDFDEAYSAPFSWDVKRGAVGFWLATARNGAKPKQCRRVVRSFVEGYFAGIRAFAEDDRSQTFQFRLDNSPKLVRTMIKTAVDDREEFLAKYVDLRTNRFVSSKKRVAHSSHVAEFQDVVDGYVRDNDLGDVPRPDDFFTVLDVARKKKSGTGSLGLDRYWLLLQGWGEGAGRSVILELKQARRSALYGLAPADEFDDDEGGTREARRIVTAQQVHLVHGDALYGFATYDGISFLARERSPYKYEVDTEELDLATMVAYADLCGQALSQPHARSDEETGIADGSAEEKILESVDEDLFVDDVIHFAEDAAARIMGDFELFRRDHALGAFRYWDMP